MKQLTSKQVYKNRWMTVREDEVEFDNGTRGIYGVVEKTDFSMIIPFDGQNFYIVKQFRYTVQGSYWEFPQGSFETAPDTDPFVVAQSELLEEAGLTAAGWQEIAFLYIAYGVTNHGFHVYVATELHEGEQQPEETEQDMEVKKVSIAEFEQMIEKGEIRDAPTISAYGLLKMKKFI